MTGPRGGCEEHTKSRKISEPQLAVRTVELNSRWDASAADSGPPVRRRHAAVARVRLRMHVVRGWRRRGAARSICCCSGSCGGERAADGGSRHVLALANVGL